LRLCAFAHNTAGGSGGAIYYDSCLKLDKACFVQGIGNQSSSRAVLLRHNKARAGGAVFVECQDLGSKCTEAFSDANKIGALPLLPKAEFTNNTASIYGNTITTKPFRMELRQRELLTVVDLSETVCQHSFVGHFTYLQQFDGRPAYANADGSRFLYHFSSQTQWCLSAILGSTDVTAYTTTNAWDVNHIDTVWQEWCNGAWTPSTLVLQISIILKLVPGQQMLSLAVMLFDRQATLVKGSDDIIEVLICPITSDVCDLSSASVPAINQRFDSLTGLSNIQAAVARNATPASELSCMTLGGRGTVKLAA